LEADPPRAWLATCPRGTEGLLAAELRGIGADAVVERPQGVEFTGTRAVMYRACLWSRVANRVFLPLDGGAAGSADALYATLLDQPWEELIAPRARFAVSFHGSNAAIRNTRFGAQRSKDAIVDRFRGRGLAAPEVSLDEPDIIVSVRLRGERLDVALDLVGESLHRRGYRRGSGAAPLKENLAAALLLRAGWPALAAEAPALIDPMCGSATLLIEGALMALDRAPGLERSAFAFEAWCGHEADQWDALCAEARSRAEQASSVKMPEIRGYDSDPRVIRRAEENIAAAGLSRQVRVSVKALGEIRRPTHRALPRGLLITNPPYGERIGNASSLPPLYRRLGKLFHDEFSGWEAALLAPEADLARATGLRSHRHYAFFNGRIPVSLYLFTLRDNTLADAAPAAPVPAPDEDSMGTLPSAQAQGAEMLANRLRKNLKRLERWRRRAGVDCYRLYDADLPEYAVAIDVYADWLHVAEYQAPKEIPQELARERLAAVRAVLPEATGVPAERIVFKRRERQRKGRQYERQGNRNALLTVHEGAVRLLVNLHDYLDTGLFLDHRALRLRIAGESRGRRFLNLFCYTGSATVHAAAGGARETVSVDLSNTYLAWLEKNLAANGLSPQRNRVERADAFNWLRETSREFDLILLDPPSFSNSAAMVGSLDVQRDHGKLVELAMQRLAPGGTLYFSNNRRRFRLDPQLAERFSVEDITASTLDPDFARATVPHRCWKIGHAAR
jgi:23S rRNA (guanine2445-N2)-methyltransferase / 23S rRNA (guanine2069-N7)-methyltransferase